MTETQQIFFMQMVWGNTHLFYFLHFEQVKCSKTIYSQMLFNLIRYTNRIYHTRWMFVYMFTNELMFKTLKIIEIEWNKYFYILINRTDSYWNVQHFFSPTTRGFCIFRVIAFAIGSNTKSLSFYRFCGRHTMGIFIIAAYKNKVIGFRSLHRRCWRIHNNIIHPNTLTY